MSETDPNDRKRLDPWLSNELRAALDERDVDAVFILIGDYLEYHKLRMPAERLADYRSRGLLETSSGS